MTLPLVPTQAQQRVASDVELASEVARRIGAAPSFRLGDVLLGTAAAAIIFSGVFVHVLAAHDRGMLDSETANLKSIVRTVSALSDGGSTRWVSMKTLQAVNAFPRSMVRRGWPESVWGGAVSVSQTEEGDGFVVAYAGVPRDACVSLGAQAIAMQTKLSVDMQEIDLSAPDGLRRLKSECYAHGTAMLRFTAPIRSSGAVQRPEPPATAPGLSRKA